MSCIELAPDAAHTEGIGVRSWEYRFHGAESTVFERPKESGHRSSLV